MDFAIARDFRAGAIEDHGGVVDPFSISGFFQDRAGMNIDAMFFGELLHRAIGRAAGNAFGRRQLGLAIAAEKIETFGQRDPIRPLFRDRLFDEARRGGDIGGLVADRIHLDQGNFHGTLRHRVQSR
jgi:hypothetical protein